MKKKRRDNVKYPALDPKYNLKSRTDLIDYDYLDKLSDADKKWLNDFTEEYTNASFDPKKYKRKNKKPINKTKEQKSDCYRRNNNRNNCIYTKAKASSRLISTEEVLEENLLNSGDQSDKDGSKSD